MAEHSFDIGGGFGGPNGTPPNPVATIEQPVAQGEESAFIGVEQGESLPAYRVDPARSLFITSRGDEIHLTGYPIGGLVLQRVQEQGKPEIPKVEVTILGKHKQVEANPKNEGYLALYKEWEDGAFVRALKYTFWVGVKGNAPQDFIDLHTDFFPDADAKEMKYLWVSSYLTEDEILPLFEAILGRATPTTEGIKQAANFTTSK